MSQQCPSLARLASIGFPLYGDVGQEQQRRRIESRRHDPLKHWKLSPIDFASMKKRDEYTMDREVGFGDLAVVEHWDGEKSLAQFTTTELWTGQLDKL